MQITYILYIGIINIGLINLIYQGKNKESFVAMQLIMLNMAFYVYLVYCVAFYVDLS